jgi:hypothetical protein
MSQMMLDFVKLPLELFTWKMLGKELWNACSHPTISQFGDYKPRVGSARCYIRQLPQEICTTILVDCNVVDF